MLSARLIEGYVTLPGGILLQWGIIPGNRPGGDYDPYVCVFPTGFSDKPHAVTYIQEKGDGARDPYCYCNIYTGTYNTGRTNGLFSSYMTVTATNEWKGYWMAIGKS